MHNKVLFLALMCFAVLVLSVSACTSKSSSVEIKDNSPATNTAIPVPKNDNEYYEEKMSQLFLFPSENLEYYNVVRGKLDIESTGINYFSANFLDDVLQSYKLTVFGELGKEQYQFDINDGFVFLYYVLTEYTEPLKISDAKTSITRLIADNDELLLYDRTYNILSLSAIINDEQQSIFNNALDFKQKIINNEFQKGDWVEAFSDLIQYGDINGHFQKIILVDVDFDGIPELFLTMSSITAGYNHWINQGFIYKDGMVTDIKISLPINLELYSDRETKELIWMADGVGEHISSNRIMTFCYNHYWVKADFNNIRTVWSPLFHWKEEYTAIWDVEDSQSESVFTLLDDFDDERTMSKIEIEALQNEVFSKYEHIDTVRVIGDAQKFGLVNWYSDGWEFPRDELLSLLSSYEKMGDFE